DDLTIGVKSTALRFGAATKAWVYNLYAGAVFLWAIAGALAGAGVFSLLALMLAAIQLAWQIKTLDIDDPANCLTRFKSNRYVGWLLLGGMVADMAIRL